MIRSVALAIAIVALATQSALAIPGQTPSQLLAWGKSVAALHGFKPSMDEETGGTVYLGKVTIDGHAGDFSSEPSQGIVHQEYVSFNGVNDVGKSPTLLADTIRSVYGADYANDFLHAAKLPLHGQVVAWRGAKLAYATLGSALFMIRNADFPAVLKNIHTCDAIDCGDAG